MPAFAFSSRRLLFFAHYSCSLYMPAGSFFSACLLPFPASPPSACHGARASSPAHIRSATLAGRPAPYPVRPYPYPCATRTLTRCNQQRSIYGRESPTWRLFFPLRQTSSFPYIPRLSLRSSAPWPSNGVFVTRASQRRCGRGNNVHQRR